MSGCLGGSEPHLHLAGVVTLRHLKVGAVVQAVPCSPSSSRGGGLPPYLVGGDLLPTRERIYSPHAKSPFRGILGLGAGTDTEGVAIYSQLASDPNDGIPRLWVSSLDVLPRGAGAVVTRVTPAENPDTLQGLGAGLAGAPAVTPDGPSLRQGRPARDRPLGRDPQGRGVAPHPMWRPGTRSSVEGERIQWSTTVVSPLGEVSDAPENRGDAAATAFDSVVASGGRSVTDRNIHSMASAASTLAARSASPRPSGAASVMGSTSSPIHAMPSRPASSAVAPSTTCRATGDTRCRTTPKAGAQPGPARSMAASGPLVGLVTSRHAVGACQARHRRAAGLRPARRQVMPEAQARVAEDMWLDTETTGGAPYGWAIRPRVGDRHSGCMTVRVRDGSPS